MTVLQSLIDVGFTHAESVMPYVRSSDAESATSTRSFVPSNESAPPYFPAAVQVAPGRNRCSSCRTRRGRASRAFVEVVRGDELGSGAGGNAAHLERDFALRETAVVDADFVDEAVEPLAPDGVAADREHVGARRDGSRHAGVVS